MAQWGKNDAATNSVSWGAASLNKGSGNANQAANNTSLFGNTTADAFVTGQTIGQYGVDSNEIAANFGGTAHTGWVLRREGSGGRAGRVMTEVLVAGGITGDAEDVAYPDYTLRITTQPSDASGNSAANETVTFTSAAASTPSGATITYLWQYTTDAGNTDTWATTVGVTGIDDQTTTTLSVNTAAFGTANAAASGHLFRLIAQTTGAVNAVSASAELTITE